MTSKKYKLLLVLLVFLGSTAFAQMDKSYTVYDSSVIPQKRMPQQNEFWNNQYNFPAKPRNQWEVGASFGSFMESSDVPVVAPTFGFGVHVRKAFGYLFSLRMEYVNGVAKGLAWQPSDNYSLNTAWTNPAKGIPAYNPLYRNPAGQLTTLTGGPLNYVFYNYKTNLQDLSLQGIITLNNIRFHKQKTGIVIYGGGGIGATLYKCMINTGNESNGTNYAGLFDYIQSHMSTVYTDRRSVRKALKNGAGGFAGMDNTYETPAESETGRFPHIGAYTLKPSGTVLFGASYKINKSINIYLEDRNTFVKTDLLDGQQWQESAPGSPVMTRDFDSYNVLQLGLNFNLGSKAVEPLWWLNPLDYAYSELNNPRHTKFPKPKFVDSDGDGVIDELDREPNTPAGCPVDTHGVMRDTDGDGVPDCKDKELITPTYCQPVDADGVGKCPCPDSSCFKNFVPVKVVSCPADYPSVSFKANGTGLSGDAKALLAKVAAKLKENPTCKIQVVGYPAANKANQSRANARLESIKKQLIEVLGISADRITTDTVVGGGDENTFDIKSN